MCDMEVHEHMLVSGRCRTLKKQLLHNNTESLSRYIEKHNQYSNWEVRVLSEAYDNQEQLQPSFWGTQAERRRWLRRWFFMVPGSPVLFFLLKYVLRLGFLDGASGLIYCGFQAVQFFHIKAKLYEARLPGRDHAFEYPAATDRTHVRH